MIDHDIYGLIAVYVIMGFLAAGVAYSGGAKRRERIFLFLFWLPWFVFAIAVLMFNALFKRLG